MDSLVSIIIPTYNRSHFISDTLNSVLNQTFTNWECLIIDDGSTDNTIEIAKSFIVKDSRFYIVNRPPNKPKGANACRNYGFKLSKGNYVLFLDSDDILKDTCLENRINAFKATQNLDFVIANTSYVKQGVFYNKPICEFPSDYGSEDYLKLFLSYKLPWTIMSVLWKKETIKDFMFDEHLSRFQDVDFHVTVLLSKTYKIAQLNKVDNYYRIKDDKILSDDYIVNVISSFNFFLKKYIYQDRIQSGYANNFKTFVVFFLVNYLYPNYKKHKSKINSIEDIIKDSKLFSSKELYLLKIKKKIITSGLTNKKGLGVNKFNKLIMKGLKYE